MLSLSKNTASISKTQSLLRSVIVASTTSAISIISLGAIADSVSAISLIGNTTGATNTTGLSFSLIDTDHYAAVQFTTPSSPTAGYYLNFINLKVSSYRTNGLASSGNLDNILISITDNSNLTIPGNDLFTGFGTASSTSNALKTITLNANSTFIFTPNTTYWLQVAAADATTTFNWTSNYNGTTGDITPTGLATLGSSGYVSTADAGLNFSPNTFSNTFNIDVTPVPFEFEASGGILILAGLFAANKLRQHINNNKSEN